MSNEKHTNKPIHFFLFLNVQDIEITIIKT